ncbi:hypothetical protein HU200_011542 [Digitaria exilis]|uniref:F-box domain-containing protein n=1 Tax=Digitaria exilis TaxID=1010633 RepID=A0A835FH07_9POAL|nr:hypothetical protein HU200_011542 [Digitaria exilis]CAB3446403.1 unnamed protein product [Digitaria exilis]
MEEAKRERSTLAAASAAAISLVLGDCDLLGEIFLRIVFPTDLVRAAAVCRRWLRAASDPAFLRRFRDAHPPRLLGFYLTAFSTNQSFSAEFVPMTPQPPEVDAVVRRGRFGLDSYVSRSTRVMDCRNSRVVVNLFRDGYFTPAVHSPLHPARGLVTLPRLPVIDDQKLYIFREVFCQECDNVLSYFWFELHYNQKDEKATADVYKLHGDAWSMQISASTKTLRLLTSVLNTFSVFLVNDKIYMGITVHNILVLDLTSSTFSTINYPMKYSNRVGKLMFDGEIMLSRANGSGVYLVHVKELQLFVWFHSGCHGSMGDWSLVNTIGLRDLCANLKISNSTTEDDYDRDVYIHAVGDNAEFVFLQMYQCVLYLDVRRSALQNVCNMTGKKAHVTSIHPYLMTWPPIFPVLKE